MISFSAEDQAELRTLTEDIAAAREWKHRPFGDVFSQCLRLWNKAVSSVEESYEADPSEYSNDLSARDILEDFITRASSSLQKKIRSVLDPLDDRFKIATLEIPHPIWKGRTFWVYFRVPKKARDDFGEAFNYVLPPQD